MTIKAGEVGSGGIRLGGRRGPHAKRNMRGTGIGFSVLERFWYLARGIGKGRD